jgi:hypothetical protein
MMDKCEQVIKDALCCRGIKFVTEKDNPAKLDFLLTEYDIHIEVKQFHSDRIAKQMASAKNVIAVQGYDACLFLGQAIARAKEFYIPTTNTDIGREDDE